MAEHPNVHVVSRDELLDRVTDLRHEFAAIQAARTLDEVSRELDEAYFLLGGCPHEYDDDLHWGGTEFASDSKPGDPCIWCPESKPTASAD